MLSDVLEIHFIDMVKFRRLKGKDIANNRLHRWLTFLNKNTNDNILEEVINMDTAIQKAQEKMIFVTNDKEKLRAYQMRMLALSDQVSGINYARHVSQSGDIRLSSSIPYPLRDCNGVRPCLVVRKLKHTANKVSSSAKVEQALLDTTTNRAIIIIAIFSLQKEIINKIRVQPSSLT
jgi:hypothetical protein